MFQRGQLADIWLKATSIESCSSAGDQLATLIEGRTDLAGGPASFEALARGTDPASKVLVFPQGLSA